MPVNIHKPLILILILRRKNHFLELQCQPLGFYGQRSLTNRKICFWQGDYKRLSKVISNSEIRNLSNISFLHKNNNEKNSIFQEKYMARNSSQTWYYFIFEFWFVSDLTAGERMIVKGQRLPEFNANRNLHQLHLHQQQLRQGQKLKFISHMDIKYKLDFSVGETLWKVQMHYS